MGLFIRKPIDLLLDEARQQGNGSLRRVLGPVSLIAMGVGVIVGAGLFSITGLVAANFSGPAITLSFVIAALCCCFAGLCYAEFASMIPVAGSAYTYSYATMGELVAWVIGWDLVLEYSVAATTVSISWSRYVVSFFDSVGIATGADGVPVGRRRDERAGLPHCGAYESVPDCRNEGKFRPECHYCVP